MCISSWFARPPSSICQQRHNYPFLFPAAELIFCYPTRGRRRNASTVRSRRSTWWKKVRAFGIGFWFGFILSLTATVIDRTQREQILIRTAKSPRTLFVWENHASFEPSPNRNFQQERDLLRKVSKTYSMPRSSSSAPRPVSGSPERSASRSDIDRRPSWHKLPSKKTLFVGVMSATKFVPTRVQACHGSWGKELGGDIRYLVGLPVGRNRQEVAGLEKNLSKGLGDARVVVLTGTNDNEYPPQKKAFLTLKEMCGKLDDYWWFMRADDDVFIRLHKLRAWLEQLDPTTPLYIGAFGLGRGPVRSKLGLEEAFCMGGPGVIFSSAAMQGLCPHITECLNDVISGEEDVEIGRCVYKHLGIGCTKAWELLDLFYHEYPGAFQGLPHSYMQDLDHEIPDVAKNHSVTLHAIKEPFLMFRMKKFFLNSEIRLLRESGEALSRRLVAVVSHSPDKKFDSLKIGDFKRSMPSVDYVRTLKFANAGVNTQREQSLKIGQSMSWALLEPGVKRGQFKMKEVLQEFALTIQTSLNVKQTSLAALENSTTATWRLDLERGKELMRLYIQAKSSILEMRLSRSVSDPVVHLAMRRSQERTLIIVLPVLPEMFENVPMFVEALKQLNSVNADGASSVRLCVVVFSKTKIFNMSLKDLLALDKLQPQVLTLHEDYSPLKALTRCFRLFSGDILKQTMLYSEFDFFLATADVRVKPSFIDRCHTAAVPGREVFLPLPSLNKKQNGDGRWAKPSPFLACIHKEDIMRFVDEMSSAQDLSAAGSRPIARSLQFFQSYEPGLEVVTRASFCRSLGNIVQRFKFPSCATGT